MRILVSTLVSAASVNRLFKRHVSFNDSKIPVEPKSPVTGISSLGSQNSDSIADLMTRCFPTSDPHSWGRPLGYTDDGFRGYMTSYVPGFFAKENHAAIGVMSPNNGSDVQAVLLLEPLGALELKTGAVFNRSEPIEALLGACREVLLEQFRIRFPTISEKDAAALHCGYVAWVAVDASLRRRGTAMALIAKVSQIFEQRDYKFSVAYCTSPKSRDAFLKSGYELWGSVTYATFKVDDMCPFESLPDAVYVVVKQLAKV